MTQLGRLGCDLAQGYFFAAPLSAADLAEELRRTQRASFEHGAPRPRLVADVA